MECLSSIQNAWSHSGFLLGLWMKCVFWSHSGFLLGLWMKHMFLWEWMMDKTVFFKALCSIIGQSVSVNKLATLFLEHVLLSRRIRRAESWIIYRLTMGRLQTSPTLRQLFRLPLTGPLWRSFFLHLSGLIVVMVHGLGMWVTFKSRSSKVPLSCE